MEKVIGAGKLLYYETQPLQDNLNSIISWSFPFSIGRHPQIPFLFMSSLHNKIINDIV